MELEQSRPQFEKLGLGVLAVSYDTVAILHAFSERKHITFPLLSDSDSQIIKALGILNQEIPKDNPFYGIPHPVTYLLDAHGVIRDKFSEADYKLRYTAAEILVNHYHVPASFEQKQTPGKQLTLRTAASAAVVRPGQRIALEVVFDLKPGMHVYAPGVEGYIPIEWKLTPGNGWTEHEVSFPTSRKLFLKAINETVPVYEGQVRLTRDITIGMDAKGKVDVAGVFRYQACDDHICYIPETLPLQWSFEVEGHDRERVAPELRRKVQ